MNTSKQALAILVAGISMSLLSGYKWGPTGQYLPSFFCPGHESSGGLIEEDSSKYLNCFNDCQNYQITDKHCNAEGSNNENRGVPKALQEAYNNSFSNVDGRYIKVLSTSDGQSVTTLKNQFLASLPEGQDNRSNPKFTAYDLTQHNFHVVKDNSYIEVTFINETSSLASSFGYFTFKVENGKAIGNDGQEITGVQDRNKINEIIIYPNYSSQLGDASQTDASNISRPLGSHDVLQTGQTAVLGPFPKDTWVGFFTVTSGYSRKTGVDPLKGWTYQLGNNLDQQGIPKPNSEFEVGDMPNYIFFNQHVNDYGDFYKDASRWFYYSLRQLNDESVAERAHSIVLSKGASSSSSLSLGTGGIGSNVLTTAKKYFLMGFEDYPLSHPLGDKDYNDLIILVQSEGIGLDECVGNDCTCAARDSQTPASLADKNYIHLGGTELDWDGDGIPNTAELPGEYCVVQTNMCYDPTLADISGAVKNSANKLFFYPAGTTSVTNASLVSSSVAANGNESYFKTSFNTNNAQGELSAHQYQATNWSDKWLASVQMPAENSRKIYFTTQNQSTLKAFTSSNLNNSNDQQILVHGFEIGSVPTNGEVNANIHKHRESKLGSIMNSHPVYVGSPSQLFTNNNYYQFSKDNAVPANRDAHVFVAANDGKLHAFNADTGKESFAYIPKAVFPNLYKLNYSSTNATMLNDGQITVADVYDGTSWKTVVVGLLGGAAKGAYALEVTDAIKKNSTAAPNLMWELSTEDLKALGYTFGKPLVLKVMMQDGAHWVAIFGSGYRGLGNSLSNKPGLVVVDMFSAKTLFIPVSEDVSLGVASPSAIDADEDGDVETVYIGSLMGNLWRINLKNYSFGSAKLTKAAEITTPFFTTQDHRPITVPPTVIRAAHHKHQILFGTGKYFETGDETPNTATTEYVYSLRASDSTTSVAQSKLVGRNIMAEPTGSGDFSKFRVLDTSVSAINYDDTDPALQQSGWYLPLKIQGSAAIGERVVEPISYVEGLSRAFSSQKAGVMVSTLIVSSSTTQCMHSGWLMALDPFTGTALDGVDFLNDGVDGSDKVNISGVSHSIAGGKLDGRVSAATNFAGQGHDENKVIVNGDIKTLDSKDKASGRQNWRIIETAQ